MCSTRTTRNTFMSNGNRYSLDDVYQVADTEYMEAVSLAEAFKASVAKLPDADKLTLAYQTDVENLATVYNGLTSYQQSYIDSDTLATVCEAGRNHEEPGI